MSQPEMDQYEEDQPHVDDLELVRGIAEAEHLEWQRIHGILSPRAHTAVKSKSEYQIPGGLNARVNVALKCEDGVVNVSIHEIGQFGNSTAQAERDEIEASDSSDDECEEEDDDGDEMEESDSTDSECLEDLSAVLSQMCTTVQEPLPPGPRHGLDLEDIEQKPVVIKETDKIVPVGEVASIVDEIVVVKGYENCAPMDVGSIFCNDKRKVLGRVEDIFGVITEPNYAVRSWGESSSSPSPLLPGERVMAVLSHSSYVDMCGAKSNHAQDIEDDGEGSEQSYGSDDEDNEHRDAARGDPARKLALNKGSKPGKVATGRTGKSKGKCTNGIFSGFSGCENAEDAMRILNSRNPGARGYEEGGKRRQRQNRKPRSHATNSNRQGYGFQNSQPAGNVPGMANPMPYPQAWPMAAGAHGYPPFPHPGTNITAPVMPVGPFPGYPGWGFPGAHPHMTSGMYPGGGFLPYRHPPQQQPHSNPRQPAASAARPPGSFEDQLQMAMGARPKHE